MNYILLIDTKDEKGLIFKISKILFKYDLNILSQQEYVDNAFGKFFLRSELEGDLDNVNEICKKLKEALPNAKIKFTTKRKKSVVILVTKEAHALGDILIKQYSGDFNIDIKAVISNRDNLKEFVEKFDIPFYHVPAEEKGRLEHEKEMIALIKPFNPDLIVLAKFMRILTPYFVEAFPERILNIHHSFLPAFIGANPYKQAYNRGVKIIGATAHYVNNHLDEGPIIEQDIIKVTHDLSWKEMRNRGRDIEKIVLSRAIKLVLEDRVFVYANKTIIL